MDNCTRKLLDLTDMNISFSDQNWLIQEKCGNVTADIIVGELTYKPLCCEKCGEINHGQIISNGTVKTTTQLPVFNRHLTFLRLRRTRFLCHSCGSTFVAKTPIVEENHHISKALECQILLDLKKLRSRKEIAQDHFVSDTTIMRIQRKFVKNYRINLDYLPETLCVDEFKSTKSCSGSMSFICVDGDSGKLLEILEDRRLNKLTQHFFRYSIKARRRVKYFVMDMNASYAQLIQTIFPNAELIIDRFHIVQHMNRNFNRLRIKVMNSFKKDACAQKKYRRLKRFWKLLLKKSSDLNTSRWTYIKLFKRPMNQLDIVNELLSYDETLNLAYQTVQHMRNCLQHNDPECFFKQIDNLDKELPQWFREKFKVFKKYRNGVENAFVLPYSNGITEGINNKIKTIKRVSFGYRNFFNLRDRIYLIQGLVFS